ncbi:TPA: hypothetical protein HA270_06795, partial [Candidatus Woesearchaeota archaeon]|nr:hypothetical protein [Candidatus Woesearchaeota archaeon]
MRALQWLANKGLIELSELSAFFVALGANGAAYKASGLPEKRFLQVLADTPLSVDVVARRASLEKQEASACLGLLRGKAAIEITKEKDLTVTITDAGKRLREKESLEEKFLAKKFPVNTSTLAPEERFALESLKRRKDIVSVVERKERRATITALGKKVQAVKVSSDTLDALTHGMLTDGSWKGKSFRRYDVAVNVPAIAGGKRHFVRQAISYAKRVWLDMGFSEMEGPLINTSFWNFDALFTAQDHPVREMQDTFFVKKPASGSLPSKKLVDAVSCI